MKGYEHIRNKFKGDAFANMLGIEIVEIKKGYGKARLKVTENMVNGKGITHGAVVFAVADFAFGLAANSHGRIALGLNMNISYVKPTKPGAVLTAEAVEDSLTNKTGVYRITITDEAGELVAATQGVAYRLQEIISEE